MLVIGNPNRLTTNHYRKLDFTALPPGIEVLRNLAHKTAKPYTS